MANNVKKVNGIEIADIAKINGQNDSDLEKLNGEEFTGDNKTQHYLRRATAGYGGSATIADGTTSNFADASTSGDTFSTMSYKQYTMGGSPDYEIGNDNVDAILITAGNAALDPAQVYKINGFVLGATNAPATETTLSSDVHVGIFTGDTLDAGSRLYLHTYSSFILYKNNATVDGASIGFRGGIMYEIPETSSNGDTLPLLQPNTQYAFAVGMTHGEAIDCYALDTSYDTSSGSFTSTGGRTFAYAFASLSSADGASANGFDAMSQTTVAQGQLVGFGILTF